MTLLHGVSCSFKLAYGMSKAHGTRGCNTDQVRNVTDAREFSDGRLPALKIFHNPRVQKMRKRRFLHLSEDNELRVA